VWDRYPPPLPFNTRKFGAVMFVRNFYLVSSWADNQLNAIREIRKTHNNKETNIVQTLRQLHKQCPPDEYIKELSRIHKAQLRETQQWIKASTLLLEYFYGTGRFTTHVRENDFPIDLRDKISYLLSILE
jgi:hypothetical protein